MIRGASIDLTLILLVVGLICLVGPACEAGDHVVVRTGDSSGNSGVYGTPEEEDFTRQDRNGDGVISSSEWFRGRAEFYRLDYNRDGVLTRNEFLGGGQRGISSSYASGYGPRDAFSALDFDRNGFLYPNEWTASPNDFYRLDYDHDGVLSRAEFFGRRDSAQYSSYGQTSTYSRYDRDGDGVISRFEWPSDSSSFDRLDRDLNGVLSPDEVENRQSQDGGGQALQTILEGLFRKQ